jgi:hypothetical protein
MPTRIFFTCDLHGSERCFRKFVDASNRYKANVLMINGDITGKAIVPILPTSKGQYVADFLGDTEKAKNDTELADLEKRIANVGYYPVVIPESELREVRASFERQRELFSKLVLERVQNWVDIAEKKLAREDVKCFIMPGNDDMWEVDDIISASTVIVNPSERVVDLDADHEMISLGYVNPTPWKTPRESSEEDLWKRIAQLASKIRAMDRAVFNFHTPPFNSRLDSAPKLDQKLRPVPSLAGILTAPAGSTAVRKAVEHYQPMIGLFGHIHESGGEANIGRTLCLNPGSEYSTGLLRGFVIDLERGGAVRHFRVEA